MDWLKKIWFYITLPYVKYKNRQRIKQRLKQLQEHDPYIYK